METKEAGWVALVESRLAEVAKENDELKKRVVDLEDVVFKKKLRLDCKSYFSDYWKLEWTVKERGRLPIPLEAYMKTPAARSTPIPIDDRHLDAQVKRTGFDVQIVSCTRADLDANNWYPASALPVKVEYETPFSVGNVGAELTVRTMITDTVTNLTHAHTGDRIMANNPTMRLMKFVGLRRVLHAPYVQLIVRFE